MQLRDAVESDAGRMAALTGAPTDVMRNLVHDRSVRVAVEDDEVMGFVSYDAGNGTVHVTQLEGSPEVCERLLGEPRRFAEREGMDVEMLVPEPDVDAHEAAERADFDEYGPGPRFEGTPTTRYRWEPDER